MTIAPGRPPRRTLLIALAIGLGVLLVAAVVALGFALGGGGEDPAPPVTDLPGTVTPTITPTPTGIPAPPED